MLVRAMQLIAALSALCVASSANAQLILHSYALEKQYVSAVGRDKMMATPEWKAEDDNPPLSARKAIKSAAKIKDSLVKDNDRIRWDFRSAELQDWGEDRWYWIVAYRAHARVGISTGPPTELRIIVLMDGTAVMPKTKSWPSDEDDGPADELPNSK